MPLVSVTPHVNLIQIVMPDYEAFNALISTLDRYHEEYIVLSSS